jgi:hypothetical protein
MIVTDGSIRCISLTEFFSSFGSAMFSGHCAVDNFLLSDRINESVCVADPKLTGMYAHTKAMILSAVHDADIHA